MLHGQAGQRKIVSDRIVGRDRKVVDVVFVYGDGATAAHTLLAGVHVNGYQYYRPILRGRVGWRGDSRKRKNVLLYVWDVTNPHPGKIVTQLRIETHSGVGFALVAATAERDARSLPGP